MGLIQTLRGWFNMILKRKAKDEFNVEAISTDKMDAFIKKCVNIYKGQPEWLDEKDEIKTINFAKSICSEVARLATLAIGITVDGSARAAPWTVIPYARVASRATSEQIDVAKYIVFISSFSSNHSGCPL